MTAPLPPSSRDTIRRELHEHVDAIFNRLFPEDTSVPLPAFDRIEEQTSQLTRDLESWLLEQRVQSAADARPVEAPSCPQCQQPTRRVKKPGDPLARRVLTTRAGPKKLVRTVVASLSNSDTFGYHVAAEVQRRRLNEASRKACCRGGSSAFWISFIC